MTDEPPLRRRAAESRTGIDSHHPPSAQPEPAGAGPDPSDGGPVPLTAPREGTPQPVATPDELAEVVARFAAGSGPVALDAERASGYRYSQRAYLVQLRRAGAGTVLIDPLPLPDLTALDEVIGEAEWVLHAASQDLACLAEVGLRPRRLFDTELAARLAGFERVGLAALTEQLLGFTLEKHHSAADWSTRPLPESWLTYAALDVELLTDLRDALDEELTRQGKSAWAAEEFAALVRAGARPPRVRAEPWRRTSGIHRVRGARAQARVRSMWYARDQVAARRDAAPGRVLPDSAIIAAAELDPKDEKTLLTLPGFGGRSVRRLARTWLAALDDARQLPDDALPVTPVVEGPPPPHRWAERDPVAAGRLARCREVVLRVSGEHGLPAENLIAPDSVRRLAWVPPEEITEESVRETLRGFGAREWQIGLLVSDLATALTDPPPATPE
ncbi:HRDC domain-containing protein [Micromonospora sp. NPDC049366]|uniref:HRDC domain-containing protein n=1 Tax=Micromonospora sp. NPDC049366 TaxID=3364271 RepID=UPI0037AA4D08